MLGLVETRFYQAVMRLLSMRFHISRSSIVRGLFLMEFFNFVGKEGKARLVFGGGGCSLPFVDYHDRRTRSVDSLPLTCVSPLSVELVLHKQPLLSNYLCPSGRDSRPQEQGIYPLSSYPCSLSTSLVSRLCLPFPTE